MGDWIKKKRKKRESPHHSPLGLQAGRKCPTGPVGKSQLRVLPRTGKGGGGGERYM